jgi:hypothetical protein
MSRRNPKKQNIIEVLSIEYTNARTSLTNERTVTSHTVYLKMKDVWLK